MADRVCVSFKDTVIGRHPSRTIITGNPVRRSFLTAVDKPIEEEPGEKGADETFTILILGGSQGAHSINMAVIDALAYLEDKQKYSFIHQTGPSDETLVKDAYLRLGVAGKIKSFFHDMASRYIEADLVICRAGATTVAEVTATGRAAIFIPYPFAADNHQALNAQALVDRGAAEVILEDALSGEILARRIKALAEDHDALDEKAKRSKQLGQPAAADMIVNDCLGLLR